MNDSAPTPSKPISSALAPVRFSVGSDEHKRAFCGILFDTFDAERPVAQVWPTLPPDALQRLAGLPFWDAAIETEGYACCRTQAQADATMDGMIKKAIALNAYEKARHKLILRDMLKFYEIKLHPEKAYGLQQNPEWLFLCTGYGACFDSFFAFGLFKLAKNSGFFPPALVDMFEPILQEQARHILFFVNWVAYTEINKGILGGTLFRFKTLTALALAASGRISHAGGAEKKKSGEHFIVAGGSDLASGLTLRKLIEVSMAEDKRRLAPFNPNLPRPKIVPFFAGIVLFFLKLTNRP